jgi:hypothetical protein
VIGRLARGEALQAQARRRLRFSRRPANAPLQVSLTHKSGLDSPEPTGQRQEPRARRGIATVRAEASLDATTAPLQPIAGAAGGTTAERQSAQRSPLGASAHHEPRADRPRDTRGILKRLKPLTGRFSRSRRRTRAYRNPLENVPNGASRDRTDDLRHAMAALSQLSYSPKRTYPTARAVASSIRAGPSTASLQWCSSDRASS